MNGKIELGENGFKKSEYTTMKTTPSQHGAVFERIRRQCSKPNNGLWEWECGQFVDSSRMHVCLERN